MIVQAQMPWTAWEAMQERASRAERRPDPGAPLGPVSIRTKIEDDLAREGKTADRARQNRRYFEAIGPRRPRASGSAPASFAPAPLSGPAECPVTISGGSLHRVGDADESEFALPDETASAGFFRRVEAAFLSVCTDETGQTESPEATAKREKKEKKLREQGAAVAGGLIAAGKSAYRAEGWKLFALDVHESTLDEIPAFRRICLNPWIAYRLRLPYLKWLEYWLQDQPFARFWTFTSGPRCRIGELRKRIRALCRKISALNAQPFMRAAGVEIVFRAIELGTIERTNRRKKDAEAEEIGGEIEKDAGGYWYHPHAHCIVSMERKLAEWEWAGLLEKVWAFWGNNWDEGKRIRNARECVKYVVKPGAMVELAKTDPAELGRLHDALFRAKLVQPMGSLKREMRLAAKPGLIPALRWEGKRRKWKLIVDPNKNRMANGADSAGVKAADGSDMTVSRAERFFSLHQYGLGRAGVVETPAVVRVMARCAPAFNSRGVKSPRVVVIASPGLSRAEIVAQVLRHPLIAALVAATRADYFAGLALAKAERGELCLLGGTRGNLQAPDPIRVHTGTPTVWPGRPPDPENLGPPCFSDFEPSFEECEAR